MQRGFKTATVCVLVRFELSLVAGIFFALYVSQTDPPAMTSAIDRLGAGALHDLAGETGLSIVICERDHNRAPLFERVLVDKQLIHRQSVRHRAFERFTRDRTA